MSRYKKIDSRMWGDRRFMALSDKARYLWIYLLTGPHTSSLPGVYIAGEAMLAEALGWKMKSFREAFKEIEQAGLLKADRVARLIFIPNGVKYDRPESPKVVKHWGE